MLSPMIVRPSVARQSFAAIRKVQSSSIKPASPALNAAQDKMEDYVPGGPVLVGTVNDATTFPPPSKAHGSHHWQFERLLSVALVPMTVSSFYLSNSAHPIFDGVLGAILVMHSHIGFDASLVDYLHKRKFPVIGPAASWAVKAASLGALWGIYEFNTNDVGLTGLVANLWTA